MTTFVTLRYPTTLHSLLMDETYEIYFGRKPKLPKVQELSPGWVVLAHTHEGKWRRKLISDYNEARDTTLRILHKPDFRDVCLFSRRKEFRKPIWIDSLAPFEEWCGRCRRPTLYQKYWESEHHALPNAPYLQVGVERCFFCGVRKEYFSNGRR